MFQQLRIQNFKAWQDTGQIRMAPLTVLFGSNSAGKSSLIQFLLMLKQTAVSPDRRRVLHPGDQNSLVDLGTFHDLVFEHDLSREIKFDLKWTLDAPLTISNPRSRKAVTGDTIAFAADVGIDPKTTVPALKSFQYVLTGDHGESLSASMRRGSGGYEVTATGYKLIRNPGRPWQPQSTVHFYGFPDELFAYYQTASPLSDLTLALEQRLGKIYYLGPLRRRPDRMYAWAGEVPEHVGVVGERAVEALLAARDRELSAGFRKRGAPFQSVVAGWLKRMGVLDTFTVRQIAKNRKEYEVLVRTAARKDEVALTDVGFGVSQVLPVVVECFYAPPNSTIVMEQPELHLHPAVQSELADLFIDSVRVWENGSARNIQLVIESHSEHFLRRLQRRIAEGELTSDQVALYFCEPGQNGSTIRELEIDLYGNIKNWPKDFFGDEFSDRAAMMDAIMKRKTREAKS